MNDELDVLHADDPTTILNALAHGISGDTATGLQLIRPLVLRGPISASALCASLAESACHDAKKDLPDGSYFGFQTTTDDGAPADINDAPAGLRFAAQFSTAWANGDHDTAYALFRAVIGEGTDDEGRALGEGICDLFDMAVAALTDMVNRDRT